MKREQVLPLKDLAMLLDGVEVPDGTAARLAPFLRDDPRLEEEITALELLAQDAGISPDQRERFTAAYDDDQDFKLLLRADTEWEWPDEVLDPEKGFEVGELFAIAEARLKRRPNPLLSEVREKLARANAAKRSVETLVDGVLADLLRLPAKQAEGVVATMERRYREQRGAIDE